MQKISSFIFSSIFLLLLIFVLARGEEEEGEEGKKEGYKIVTIEWHEVKLPYTVALWIVFSSIAKIRWLNLLPGILSVPRLAPGG